MWLLVLFVILISKILYPFCIQNVYFCMMLLLLASISISHRLLFGQSSPIRVKQPESGIILVIFSYFKFVCI